MILPALVILVDTDPHSSALANFSEILERVDYCSPKIKTALSLSEIKSGNRNNAKGRMQALVALTPFDSECLDSAFQVAFALGDQSWAADLLAHVKLHLRRRPYLAGCRIVFERHKSQSE